MKNENKDYKVFDIPLHSIYVDESFNCRSTITRDSVEELKGSIEQEGLLFPIDVRPSLEDGFDYGLVCGFRRYTTCRILGWVTIPARVHENITDRQASVINLTENLERSDLNILEEANALESLFPSYRTIRSIATELNKDTKWVSIRRHLITMSPFIQNAAASGRLTARDLSYVRSSADPDKKARSLMRLATTKEKTKATYTGSHVKKKSEVRDLIAKMLAEGFNPQLVRTIGWCIGDVDDEELDEALSWLRDKMGWLR